MFTVTIESQNGSEKSIREWPTCDIFRFGSDQFQSLVKADFERMRAEMPEDEAMELADQYMAVLRSVCGEYEYYLKRDQIAYVTNSNGKTVAVVK